MERTRTLSFHEECTTFELKIDRNGEKTMLYTLSKGKYTYNYWILGTHYTRKYPRIFTEKYSMGWCLSLSPDVWNIRFPSPKNPDETVCLWYRHGALSNSDEEETTIHEEPLPPAPPLPHIAYAKEIELLVKTIIQTYPELCAKTQYKDALFEDIRFRIECEYEMAQDSEETFDPDEFILSSESIISDFLKSEVALNKTLVQLSPDYILKLFPNLLSYGFDRALICDILQNLINRTLENGDLEPSSFMSIESMLYDLIVSETEYEIKTIKENQYADILETIKPFFTIDAIKSKYHNTIISFSDTEYVYSQLEKYLDLLLVVPSTFDFDYLTFDPKSLTKDSFYNRLENYLSDLYQKEKTIDDFEQKWGSLNFFLEVTPEKREQFAKIEAGTYQDKKVCDEYDIYKMLQEELSCILYNKKTKKLKPTFSRIDDLIKELEIIIDLCKKHRIIDENETFISFSSFEAFKQDYIKRKLQENKEKGKRKRSK